MSKFHTWLKYRTKHAHGPGDWQFKEITIDDSKPLDSQVADELADLEEQLCTHHDGWRGVEGHVELPPRSFFEHRLKQIDIEIDILLNQRKRFAVAATTIPEKFIVQYLPDRMGGPGGWVAYGPDARTYRGGVKVDVPFTYDKHAAQRYVTAAEANEVAKLINGTIEPY